MTDKQKEEIIDLILINFTYLEEVVITDKSELIRDFGFDDLDTVELLMVLESHYQIQIDEDAWYKIKTVEDIFNLIESKL